MKATKHLRNRPARRRAHLFDPRPDAEALIKKCERSGKLDWRERDLLHKFARLSHPDERAWKVFWKFVRECGVEEEE